MNRRKRSSWAPWLLLAVLLVALNAQADQYHSEARSAPSQVGRPGESASQMLQQTKDPYARAMLLRDMASAAAAKGDYRKAQAYLKQALGENALSGPAQAQMRKNLAALGAATGNPNQVISALQGQTNLSPRQHVALGAAYAKLKRWTQAATQLERGVNAVKHPPASWLQTLAAAEIGAGRFVKGADALSRLLLLQPNDRERWLQLASTQLKAGLKLKAQTTLELCERLGYLHDPNRRMQLIELMASNGNPYQAAALMNHWLDVKQLPDSAFSQRTLGSLWQRARERDLAIKAYRRSIAMGGSSALYQVIGGLYLQQANYKKAEHALSAAIKRGANGGKVWLNLAMARYQLGDVDGAMKAFQAASKPSSTRRVAQQWLTYLQSDAARRLALQAAASNTNSNSTTGAGNGPTNLFGQGNIQLGANEGQGEGGAVPMGNAAGLTPVGAQAAGSANGVIPPWTGGLTRNRWPAAYKPGGRYVNPYPNEKPRFTITSANWKQYAANLAPGYQALFKEFPDYVMHVYPTHRDVWYPQAIYKATEANAGHAKLLGPDALADARLGFPFPQPKNGVEAMWNHRVRYRGDSLKLQSMQSVVFPSGRQQRLQQTEYVYARYANLKDPVNISKDNILLYYLTTFFHPNGGFDFLALVHETANSLIRPRSIWVMPPSIPRLFRIPPVGYDQPFPGSNGMFFVDMLDMYNGAFNRYVWKLEGKREMYIPYNDYSLSSGRYSYNQLLTPHHFNQGPVRYELHRVWVVEATLRPGATEVLQRRVFYIDEDSWNIVLVDNYDKRGHLWLFQEGHLLPLYNIGAADCIPTVTYNLRNGAYFANRLIGHEPPIQFNVPNMSAASFSPGSVTARYAR